MLIALSPALKWNSCCASSHRLCIGGCYNQVPKMLSCSAATVTWRNCCKLLRYRPMVKLTFVQWCFNFGNIIFLCRFSFFLRNIFSVDLLLSTTWVFGTVKHSMLFVLAATVSGRLLSSTDDTHAAAALSAVSSIDLSPSATGTPLHFRKLLH